MRIFNEFSEIFKISTEIDDLSVKSSKVPFSGLISDYRQFWNLEYHGKKLSSSFFRFSIFHDQIIISILKLPSKTEKMPSKVRIAVKTSLLNCSGITIVTYRRTDKVVTRDRFAHNKKSDTKKKLVNNGAMLSEHPASCRD